MNKQTNQALTVQVKSNDLILKLCHLLMKALFLLRQHYDHYVFPPRIEGNSNNLCALRCNVTFLTHTYLSCK